MTLIHRLFDVNDLELELQTGYVRERRHPHDPDLTIFNYTEKAQYEKRWTSVTMQCRGLIVNNVTDEILARPWPKFFNLGEHDQSRLALGTPVVAQDKMDGSLGILYHSAFGAAIATRGSFESEQAIHATEVLNRQYLPGGRFKPDPDLTYLFEIIYPGNRIVLDYGHIDDLVLLDVIETATGRSVALDEPPAFYAHGWPGAVVERLPATTLGEALDLPDRKNAEGLVITYVDGMKLKIKQEDYVRLHKIVTGLNERVVWEHLAANHGRIDQLLMVVPDEFHEWTQKVADGLLEQFEVIQGRAHAAYAEIMAGFEAYDEDFGDRKDFAEEAKQRGDLTPLLFQLLDGRDISDSIWKTLRPRGETQSLLDRNEDNS